MGNWIQMGMKKIITLKMFFFKYLISLLSGYVISCMIPYFILVTAISSGFVIQSNMTEIQAQQAANKMRESSKVNLSILPRNCYYAVYDSSYKVTKTNMEDKVLQEASRYVRQRGEFHKYNFILVQKNGQFIVLQYTLGPKYAISLFNDYMINPDRLCIGLIIFNCILISILITTVFVKKLNKQLLPLFCIADNIKMQKLDFATEVSDIREINNVLQSFSDMKDELKKSLEEKWRIEKRKNDQIMALSHDLKTPLTIIRGNADLLSETELDNEQKECVEYLIDSAMQMQEYIKQLIELSKLEDTQYFKFENIISEKFITDIVLKITGLTKIKHISLKTDIQISREVFSASAVLLERSILNIVDNGIERTPDNGTLYFKAIVDEEKAEFEIIDSGKGFSNIDLRMAKDKFYMGDKSRNQIRNNHYGMGLYIANVIAEQHGGELSISNSESGSGKVTITIKSH